MFSWIVFWVRHTVWYTHTASASKRIVFSILGKIYIIYIYIYNLNSVFLLSGTFIKSNLAANLASQTINKYSEFKCSKEGKIVMNASLFKTNILWIYFKIYLNQLAKLLIKWYIYIYTYICIYVYMYIHCSKKLKEHFFIRVWHDFNCTSLIMMWSVK